MTFEGKLARAATLVERHIDVLLSESPAVPRRMVAAMQHAALGGGKRFRPFLVIESAALFGVAAEAAVPTAAALELIHCYSLVHDDLPAMDNDLMRRGRPTVWTQFDEWTAILAGDALLTLGLGLLAEARAHPEPGVRCQLIAALAAASGAAGMVGGQCLDLEADKLSQPARPDLAHIARLQAMKTGALIAFGAEAGAILGQGTPALRQALRTYGERIGLAFQIADDLLDVEGDAGAMGKAVAKDAAAGKATTVSLMGVEAAKAKLAETEAEAIAALAPFGGKADILIEAARFVSRRSH
jgi:farnesyl diphosphate synthase